MPRVCRSAWLRVPCKAAILAVVVLLVMWPDPRLLVRHLSHVRHMSHMVDPAAAGLAGFEREFRSRLDQLIAATSPRRAGKSGGAPVPQNASNPTGEGRVARGAVRFTCETPVLPGTARTGETRGVPRASETGGTPVPQSAASSSRAASQPGASQAATTQAATSQPTAGQMLRAVEAFVYEKVQYDWDWNVWGAADYMPTVQEMFDKGRQDPKGIIHEDCDGRAVMAASLLERLGYKARLVTDFGHVWVQAIEPRTQRATSLMGPGHADAVVATDQGNVLNVTWAMVKNVPVATALGLSVFPWIREAIVFVTLMLLLAHRRMSRWAGLAGVALAFAGWQFTRVKLDYWAVDKDYWSSTASFWMGMAYVLTGCVVMIAASRRARREVLLNGGNGAVS